MEKFNVRLKKAMLYRNIRQSELCNQTNIPKSAMSQYISGSFEPKQDRLQKIAQVLNVNEAWLMGYDDIKMEKEENKIGSELNPNSIPGIIKLDNFKQIPIIGTIACGSPILAQENYEGYTQVNSNVHADFALKCKGDSMSPKFVDGDIVLIRKQPMVENGQIAAVMIDNEATLKRVYIDSDKIILNPENLSFSPLMYQGEEMNNVHILGLAIGYTRVF